MEARRADGTRTSHVDGRERNGLSLLVLQKGGIYERRHAPGKVMFRRQPTPNIGLRTGDGKIVGMLSRYRFETHALADQNDGSKIIGFLLHFRSKNRRTSRSSPARKIVRA